MVRNPKAFILVDFEAGKLNPNMNDTVLVYNLKHPEIIF